MNREIRFRAWSLIHNDMRLNPSLSYKDGKWSLRQKGPSTLDQDDMILEQFTGVYDIFAKEIFEGDIVRQHTGLPDGNIAPVVWGGPFKVCAFGMTGTRPKSDFQPEHWFNELSQRAVQVLSIEVLGNIHEHGELLK